ncbi:hypothetical protein HHI36_019704 [Cryptolaemus montrouzieri]|uniref:J domain-containing protein n=1 Tax=Cryptolaemus montrouzieri TaxID=559131 RepID=A0ABD2N874_9CUCU
MFIDTRHLLKNVQFSTISSMKPVSTPGAPPKKKRLNQSVSPGTTDGIIHKVCSSCDFYEILGVRTDATEKEIKKSYKKLALILHPDKSQSPLAADAFKHIRNAVTTLTDPTKRILYDMYGSAMINASGSCYSFRSNLSGKYACESESNLEQNIFQDRPEGMGYNLSKDDTFVLRNILTTVFAITMILLTTFLVCDPSYSLHKTIKYSVLRLTYNLKVPYYVKENFLIENSEMAIIQVDNEVEFETINNLEYACFSEKSYRKCFSLLWYNFNRIIE